MNKQNPGRNKKPLPDKAKMIEHLANAMSQDYPAQFQKLFQSEKALCDFKNRLYTKLKCFSNEDIIQGYELYISEKPDYFPTIPAMALAVEMENKERLRKEKALCLAEELAEEQGKLIENNESHEEKPIEMARKALNSVPVKRKGDDRHGRLAKKLSSHDELLRQHYASGKIRQIITTSRDLECAVPYCQKPGVMSHSIRGGFFFCSEHFYKSM